MRTSWLLASALLLATASVAPAITISFNGNFNQDDDVVLFEYVVENTGFVTVATTSFAGGGFSPILTVFDDLGVFQFENVGYSNPVISDASLTWNSIAGTRYKVALTQYDNQAIGPSLLDGFLRDGQGNFTAMSPFNPDDPGGSFQLPGPEQRTSAWAVDFTSADPSLDAVQLPEPATGALGAIGAAVFYGLARIRRRKNQVGQLN